MFPLAAHPAVRKVLVFSDGNPHGLALLHLAQRHQKDAVFIAHGEPTSPVYPLRCKAAFLWGPASAARYREAGAELGQVLFRGCRDRWRPIKRLQPPLSCLGVFLSKMTSTEQVLGLLERVRQRFRPRRLLVRPHPHRPLTGPAQRRLRSLPALHLSDGGALSRDAREADLVLAGNSTAHTEVLLCGTPSLYCFELEGTAPDRCGHVRQGLVMEWRPDLTLAEVNDFYQAEDHRTLLRAHLDLDQDWSASREQINAIIFGA